MYNYVTSKKFQQIVNECKGLLQSKAEVKTQYGDIYLGSVMDVDYLDADKRGQMLPDDATPHRLEVDNKPGVGVNGNLRPATAGEVRNPMGKPPGTKNRATIAKELLSVELKAEGLDGVTGKYSAEYLVNAALLKKAMAGDVAAFKELHDTVYGKIADKQELTGKDGDAVKLDVTNLPPDEAYKRIL